MINQNKKSFSGQQKKSGDSLIKGFLMIILLLFFLMLYSVLYEHSNFLSDNFKQVNSLPLNKKLLKRNTVEQEKTQLFNQRKFLFALREKKRRDSIKKIVKRINPQNGLHNFFLALDSLKKHNNSSCRIAYYGDSMIEGDLMSMTLRQAFQKDFGGKGIGYMPITSQTNNFRINIEHQFSENWKKRSLLDITDLEFPIGISGEVFFNDSSSTVNHRIRYKASKRRFADNFPTSTLFYGKSKNKDAVNRLIFNDIPFVLEGNKIINSVLLSQQELKEIELDFNLTNTLPIYGITIESKKGVLLDNFALRGNSGTSLSYIQPNVLKSFDKELNYDLIILQFGLNVVSGKTSFNWYKNRMKRVIRHFKDNIPNASILLVSVPDMSYKNAEGVMETNPSIPYLVAAQSSAAEETNVSFFNLYEAMGGENSMVNWVEELKFANKDYTHFNFRGANYASKLIYKFLISNFNTFTSTKN